jgi:hypothetical protein
MPMVYSKCSNGHENRKIVPIFNKEHEGFSYSCFTGAYEKVETDGTKVTIYILDNCQECNEGLTFGPDPESVRSGAYFNYMAD